MSTNVNNKLNLKPELCFNLAPNTGSYEEIPNAEENKVYALIAYSISNANHKFDTIHTLFLIDMNEYKFIKIIASDKFIKAKDVKEFLQECNIESNSIILTLNTSPFTTYKVTEYLKTKELTHQLYNKKHYTPIIDYSKNFLHGMISMKLFNEGVITEKDIFNLTKA